MNPQDKQGLWRNCEDSVFHALKHLSAASQAADSWHDRKWAVLSVAHAAEVYCNLLLSEFDPKHPRGKYPQLTVVLKELIRFDRAKKLTRLTDSERYVIGEILPKLPDLRNELMHGPAPEEIPATDTAMALLSLLHIIRRRYGYDATEALGHSEIEREIFEEIHWRKHDAWFTAAEKLMMWEYGHEHLRHCAHCDSLTIPPGAVCHACFESNPREL
jgi:HEPN domain-containing protein